jgi:hypothetical protein
MQPPLALAEPLLNNIGEQSPPTKTFGIGIVEPLFSFYHFLHPNTLGGRGTVTLFLHLHPYISFKK